MEQHIINTDIMPQGNIRHVCIYIAKGQFKSFEMNEAVSNAMKRSDGVWIVNSEPHPTIAHQRFGGHELGLIEFFHDMGGDGYGVMADESNLELFKKELLEYVINTQVERVRDSKRELRRERNILSKLNEEKLVMENA